MSGLGLLFLISLSAMAGISWFGWLGLAAILFMWLWIIGNGFRKKMRDSGENSTALEPQSSNGSEMKMPEVARMILESTTGTKTGQVGKLVLPLVVLLAFGAGWTLGKHQLAEYSKEYSAWKQRSAEYQKAYAAWAAKEKWQK